MRDMGKHKMGKLKVPQRAWECSRSGDPRYRLADGLTYHASCPYNPSIRLPISRFFPYGLQQLPYSGPE